MILDLPPATIELIVAKAERAGVTVDELLYEFACDDEIYFDIERMKIAMQGLETEEDRLKNSVEIPKSALKDLTTFKQFLQASL